MRKICTLILLLAVGQASAATMYSYAGNSFDTFNDPGAPNVYDSSMAISGNFIVANELPQQTSADISSSILSYSFFDGVNTLTESNSTITAYADIDAGGELIKWYFDVVREEVLVSPNPRDFDDLITLTHRMEFQAGYAAFIERATNYECIDIQSYICAFGPVSTAAEGYSPGGWTQSSVVPVPAAVWLFGSALAGLGWVRRRQAA